MYKIIRFYQKDGKTSRTICRGLTLDEAQKHCNDPETSSSTCKTSKAKAITKRNGAWFDGYQSE